MSIPCNPYLIRAIHVWLSDIDDIPHFIVDANYPDVAVPREYVKDGKITLNASFQATNNLTIEMNYISFETRFSGASHKVWLPVGSILEIFGSETGDGLKLPPVEPNSKTPNLKLV